MATLYPNWFDQVYLKNSISEGVVFNAGGKITAFYTGTSDEAPVYNESDSLITQPVIIGTDGRAQFKLDDTIHYDIFIVDNNDNPIDSHEDVYLGAPSSGAGSGNLRGTLTDNIIPVASGAETLEDGSITDDGSTVTLSTPLDVANNPIKNVEYIDFNTSPGSLDHVEGRTYWDATDGTKTTDLADGVKLQDGQEILLKAKNSSGLDNPNGSAVYIIGAAGQRIEVDLAEADNSLASACTIGIATQDILSNNTGFYTSFGLVRDIDTSLFSDGDRLYLGVNKGEIVNVKPAKPNREVFVGICVRSHAVEGSIYVKISPNHYLNELSNVSADSPIDGDIIKWNSSTGLYELVNLNTTLADYLQLAGGTMTGNLIINNSDFTITDGTNAILDFDRAAKQLNVGYGGDPTAFLVVHGGMSTNAGASSSIYNLSTNQINPEIIASIESQASNTTPTQSSKFIGKTTQAAIATGLGILHNFGVRPSTNVDTVIGKFGVIYDAVKSYFVWKNSSDVELMRLDTDGLLTASDGIASTTGTFSTLVKSTGTTGFQAESVEPNYTLNRISSAVDEKKWDIVVNADGLQFRSLNDASTAATFWASATRGVGRLVTDFTLRVPFIGTSTGLFSGLLTANGGAESVKSSTTEQLNGNIFNQYSTVTRAGIQTAVSLAGTGAGDRSIGANRLNTLGAGIEVYLCGYYTTDAAAGNATVEIRLGGTTFRTTGSFPLDANNTNSWWRLHFKISTRTTGAPGTIGGQAIWEHQSSNVAGSQLIHIQPMTTLGDVSLDLTGVQAVDVFWSATDAGTSITCTCFSIDMVR